MAKLQEQLIAGDVTELTPERLLVIIEKMYRDLVIAINRKPDVYQQQNADGNPSDTFLSNGDITINLSTNKVEMLTNHTSTTTVVWTTLS